MPRIEFEILHKKPVEEVRRRIDEAIMKDAMLGEFELQEMKWLVPEMARIVLIISGVTYRGEILVLTDRIKVTGEVSWAAWIFRARIEDEIRRRVGGAIASSLGGKT